MASGKKQVTIYDIAREAGVSSATVSRVLSNNPKVKAENREKVLALVKKHNFTPNPMARGLAEARSNIIGILVADVRNPYYSKAFVACEQAADEYGFTVLLANSHGELERELQRLDQLAERTDAIIMLGGTIDRRMIDPKFSRKICQISEKIPIVTGAGSLPGKQFYSAMIDAYQSVDLVLDHLFSLGHRDIAQIGGSSEIISTWTKREMFQRHFARNGLAVDPELVYDGGGYDYETGYQQTNHLLSSGKHVTAIIAINDAAALGVLQSLREHHLRVPEDISVVGYDNTLFSTVAVPALTSVDYGYDLMGKRLIETAISAIHNTIPNNHQVLQPKLIVRDSTGPAPR